MQKKIFTQKIIEWYRENKRTLPWRETKDPYYIWLSEIILQQTRVAQGIPYYLKFIGRFSDVTKLAAADEQEILRLWQGLGYYTRARNLHRCAQMIRDQFGGKFPDNFLDLLKLPGIGSYTAAAIASIAFLEPVAVVDGNVFRVLSRIFGIDKDITSQEGKEYFFSLANELISKTHPDDFNQGVMEFGATWCLPANPKCDECIFKRSCIAFATGSQSLYPVKTKKAKPRKRTIFYLVIRTKNKFAMQKRESRDIWQGLFDFVSVEPSGNTGHLKIVIKTISDNLSGKFTADRPSRLYRHLLTHQTISARFISVTLKSEKKTGISYQGKQLKFYSAEEIETLPKPVLVTKYLEDNGIL